MQLGIWTPVPHAVPPPGLLADGEVYGPNQPGDETYLNYAIDVIQRADELGFDVTLVAQRLMGPDIEAWILATTLAAKTNNIVLMPAVHPGIMTAQVVAKLAASLDMVSRGRVALNIVNGWAEHEFQNFSNGQWLSDSDARYRRTDEFLDVVHQLWGGEPTTHRGEFYALDAAWMGPRTVAGRIPIYSSSHSPAGQDTVARYADVWFAAGTPITVGEANPHFDREVAIVADQAAGTKKRGADVGRHIKVALTAMVVLGDTESDALAKVDVLDSHAARGTFEMIGVGGTPLVGTAAQVAARIRALDAAGIDLLMLKFAPMRAGLDRFGAEVLPLIEDLRPA